MSIGELGGDRDEREERDEREVRDCGASMTRLGPSTDETSLQEGSTGMG